MAKKSGGGQPLGMSGKGSETTLHQSGMTKRMPSSNDASTKCKGGSVNSEPTRSSVAKSHSIGGRTA